MIDTTIVYRVYRTSYPNIWWLLPWVLSTNNSNCTFQQLTMAMEHLQFVGIMDFPCFNTKRYLFWGQSRTSTSKPRLFWDPWRLKHALKIKTLGCGIVPVSLWPSGSSEKWGWIKALCFSIDLPPIFWGPGSQDFDV